MSWGYLKEHYTERLKNTGFNRLKGIYIIATVIILLTACKVNYSFSGASISPDVKTYSVSTFINTAESFQPVLANKLTRDLKDKIQSLSSLQLVNSNGDVSFSGQITGYNISPVSIRGNDMAASNRITVTINVIYTNSINPEENFEQSFSRYGDYESSKDLSVVEDEVLDQIVDELTEDIFNRAFVNW